jgi:ribosomal protein S18 acetylase RimI-like enzyme
VIVPEPLPEGVRHAGSADLDTLARIFADAFSDDPFNLWMTAGSVGAIEGGFRAILRGGYVRRGQCFLAGDGGMDGGAAAWIDSADIQPMSGGATLRWALAMLRHFRPGAIRRGMATGEAMAAAHPEERHLYLFLVGTALRARGHGLGKKLMQPMLAACDREGLPCYLESSDPANFGFYHAHGFEFYGEPLIVNGVSPPLTPMWRAPR